MSDEIDRPAMLRRLVDLLAPYKTLYGRVYGFAQGRLTATEFGTRECLEALSVGEFERACLVMIEDGPYSPVDLYSSDVLAAIYDTAHRQKVRQLTEAREHVKTSSRKDVIA